MKLPGKKQRKDRDKEMRKQAAIKDSINTAQLEQQAMRNKQQKKQEGSNYLFDVEEARTLIEEGLKGKKTEVKMVKDQETGDIQPVQIEYDTRQKSLINEDGAEVILDEANSGALNHNTISGYLPGKTIENKVMGTLKPIIGQIVFNHHIYEIGYKNTPDASNVVSIVRNPLIDAMNKARGGRMIESQEKVRVEKESISREASDDEKSGDDNGLRSLF